ncbi:MAG: UDP-N-acetylmuramoyl-L-alanyl-D-glutamate--2,6-diaminopimelate ligase [bacterium]
MKSKSLGFLLKSAGQYEVLSGKLNPALKVASIEESSKEVKKGGLFVAVKGKTVDGHDFIGEAVKKGAKVIVVERQARTYEGVLVIKVKDANKVLLKLADAFYSDAKKRLKIIGVTGTNGKTTTTYMAAAMLKAAGKKNIAVIGTVRYMIGNKIYPAPNTTPTNLVLHKLMDEAVRSKVKYFIMEVSSHALSLGRVENIYFDAAAVTNVTRDHLDFHGTFEKYLAAKLKIVKHIKKGGSIVINAEDAHAGKFIKAAKKRKIRIVTFSKNKKADLRAGKSVSDISGMKFKLAIGKKTIALETQIIGEHNKENIMTAAGLLLKEITPQNIKKAMAGFEGVTGRLQKIYQNKFAIIIDFAHTPDGLEKTLTSLKALKGHRLVTLFGAGGNRDKGKRPLMGAVAEKLSDKIIITSDNPRNEAPEAIIADITAGLINKGKVEIEPDRKKAIAKAVITAQDKDILLLAGKGHETYQIINGVKYPFDERKIALEAVKKRQQS